MCQVCIALPNVIQYVCHRRSDVHIPCLYLSPFLWIFLSWPHLLCCHIAENASWTKVDPKGKGPCPRRRQCCCMVGDRIMLFGGTRWGMTHVYLFCDTHHFNLQFDSQFTPHIGALLLSVPTLTLKVCVLHNCDLSPHCCCFWSIVKNNLSPWLSSFQGHLLSPTSWNSKHSTEQCKQVDQLYDSAQWFFRNCISGQVD